MKKKLLLSIITPTLNNQKDIKKFLNSIISQKKINFRIEIIIFDGGSSDKTVEIAKKLGAKVYKNPYVLADPGVNLGINKAKGDILMVLAVDNIFYKKDSLQKMVDVFKDKTIMAAFPVQSSLENDSFFTKYINNFTDPFNHFVYGYAANGRTFKKVFKTLESNELYEIYDFSSSSERPLIAFAQGFAIRKGFTRNKDRSHDDILPVIDLIINKKKIAFVYSVHLYHHTVRDLNHFIRKQAWATLNSLQRKKYGISFRRDYLSDGQQLRMSLWPIYSLFIFPVLIRAFYKLVTDRDKLWILDPILCIISAYTSLVVGISYLFNKKMAFKRQK
ncbi:MAG: glycosyltransferase [Niabella sp.]|nr:MAG: glycosyltransferase [Niabella sp.]